MCIYIYIYKYSWLCPSRALPIKQKQETSPAMPRVDARAQDPLHRGADLRHSGLQDVLHALAVHVRHLTTANLRQVQSHFYNHVCICLLVYKP